MHPTRREMIRLGLGSSTLLACGSTVPVFLARSAAALGDDGGTKPPGAKADGRILVVIQLDGGNDGLNSVVPYLDDEYRKRRPRLALSAKDVLKIDDRVGFNPALDGLSTLLQKQRLAIVQGVGYPNPKRSHFESMATWQTAQLDSDATQPGWLARAIDQRPDSTGDAPALHIYDKSLVPKALAGGRQVVPSFARLDQFRRHVGSAAEAGGADQSEALARLSRQDRGTPGSLLQFVERCSLVTHASSSRLERLTDDKASSKVVYPEYMGLAKRLELIARLIKAGLSTPIYYTQLDGFDTHADQLRRHPFLLRELGTSMRVFFDDLEAAGEAGRVVVLVFSEFGRRLAENASGGTDHGTAAPVFLAGKDVRAGVHGPYPNLSDLDDGDPKHAIDFRRIYATLLRDWLGAPAEAVLGGKFEALAVLKGPGLPALS
jgi:uncharacterized protein (DUF1501 family)